MALTTQFYQMAFPEEDEDPYFDTLSGFYTTIDQNIYGLLASSQPIMGGGTVAFTLNPGTPASGIFSWTDNFEVLIPGSGFYLQIPFAADGTRQIVLLDGSSVIINVPISSTGQVTGVVGVSNGPLTANLVNLQGLCVLGTFRKGVFYSRLPQRL